MRPGPGGDTDRRLDHLTQTGLVKIPSQCVWIAFGAQRWVAGRRRPQYVNDSPSRARSESEPEQRLGLVPESQRVTRGQ